VSATVEEEAMIRDSAKLCDLVRLGAALSGVAVLAVASTVSSAVRRN